MGADLYRLLRVLEYVGPRDWIDGMIVRRQVKGTKVYGPNNQMSISEAIVGDVPTLVAPATSGEAHGSPSWPGEGEVVLNREQLEFALIAALTWMRRAWPLVNDKWGSVTGISLEQALARGWMKEYAELQALLLTLDSPAVKSGS